MGGAVGTSGTSGGGPMFAGMTLGDAEAAGEKFFAKLGVDHSADPLAAARALPWRDLAAAEVALADDSGLGEGAIFRLWDAAVDGWFLPDTPAALFQAGRHNAVPTICGANAGEMYAPPVAMPWLISSYCRQQEGNGRAGAAGYMYLFDRVPPGWEKAGLPACHTLELHYLLGLSAEDWEHILPGPATPPPELDSGDARVQSIMMKMWTHFARTGTPAIESLVDWPSWEPATDKYLYISDPLSIRRGFSQITGKSVKLV